MATRDGLTLAKSFMRITNVQLRQRIVNLVEEIEETKAEPARREGSKIFITLQFGRARSSISIAWRAHDPMRACAGRRFCEENCNGRKSSKLVNREFPSPQTRAKLLTGTFENREETWPS